MKSSVLINVWAVLVLSFAVFFFLGGGVCCLGGREKKCIAPTCVWSNYDSAGHEWSLATVATGIVDKRFQAKETGLQQCE